MLPRRNCAKSVGVARRRVLQRAAVASVERLEVRQLLSISAPSPAATAAVATKLAAEGNVEVDVRASDLPTGTVSAWSNEGAAGGTFIPWTTAAPTVGKFTDGNGVTYQAVNFNNTALKSTFNSPDDLNGNSARSIEVWVLNPTIDSGEESMVSWSRRGGPDGTNESFSYGSNYTVGEWGAEYDMTWPGSPAPGAPNTPPPANVWHNLTFTYNGSGTEDVYRSEERRVGKECE